MKGGQELEHLAAKAAKGDEESFVALCDAVKTNLFRAAIGILGDEGLALDAVSEAIFKAYKGIRRLKQPQYVLTWFTRIVINTAKDIHKKQKREVAQEIDINAAVGVDDYSDMYFNELIDGLPLELREIISLKYYSGFTVAEVATILKLPAGTVKSRLNRALKQLRLEALKGYE